MDVSWKRLTSRGAGGTISRPVTPSARVVISISSPAGAARFRLNVLGPVTIHRDGDPPASSRVTQPRRVALLCYLVLARPRGLHARDTLIALLWPEASESQGRQALRNALHGLRAVLGTRVVVSTGDQLVGVEPTSLSCDALDLEAGMIDPRRMLGDLATLEPLHGLHVGGAGDFDQWMSLERDRLRSLLRRVVAPTETDGPAGVTHARGSYSPDVWTLHARGHYLLLRAAHGGSTDDLLRSRDYFDRANALDPAFAPALAGLANFYAVAGRRGLLAPFDETFAKVIALSEQALAMDPMLAVPHVHFAVKALYLDDDWRRAGVEFATAVAKEPAYAEGHRFYGVWLGMVGRYDEALREMEHAVALEPDIPFMVSSLGAARLAVGDRAGAEDALRMTLALEPRYGPARERLLGLLEDAERFDEAVAERLREPALPRASEFASAFESDGAAGYRRVLRDVWRAEATALEARIREGGTPSVNDLMSPPIVRLVALFARLSEWKAVKTWRLQGIASRPALARWFASLPELRDGRIS